MNPDEVMLRNAGGGKDATPVLDATKPLTPEEREAFGRRPSVFRLPNPCPFVKLGPDRKGKGLKVMVGIKGEF